MTDTNALPPFPSADFDRSSLRNLHNERMQEIGELIDTLETMIHYGIGDAEGLNDRFHIVRFLKDHAVCDFICELVSMSTADVVRLSTLIGSRA